MAGAFAGQPAEFEFDAAGPPPARRLTSCFIPVTNSEGRVVRLVGMREAGTDNDSRGRNRCLSLILRNPLKLADVIDRAYRETVDLQPQTLTVGLPTLFQQVVPIHTTWLLVDVFITGCPPRADAIWYVLTELIEGRTPEPCKVSKFGA